MKRVAWLLVLWSGLPAWAGQDLVNVRFVTRTPDALFYVDEQPYMGAAIFTWPAGHRHSYRMATSQYPSFNTRYDCAATPPGPPATFTVSPDTTLVDFGCTVSYLVQIHIAPAGLASPGTVCGYDHDAEFWVLAGTVVTCSASANAGYVFKGWNPVMGHPGADKYTILLQVTGPAVLQPIFDFAVPIQVTIDSWPPGLRVLVDRASALPPMRLEWGWDTTHTLGADPVQQDNQGNYWAFDSWSDGGAINHDFTVPEAPGALSLVARFVPAWRVTFLTDPPLLRLNIDGRENWPNYTFVWPAGSRHTVTAPPEQLDSRGRKFAFRGWSDGQPAARELVIAGPPDVARYTASYDGLNQIRVATDPAGLTVQVDGQDCAAPCVVDRAAGTPVRIAAPATAAVGPRERLAFQSWADGGARERSVTTVAELRTLTARYRRQYRLQVSADPPDGVAWRLTPTSADGFYEDGTRVGIAADVLPGFRFREWDGDASGARPSALVTMTAPKSLLARLDAVPYILPDGVQNAAGPTPQPQVAARSVVSVFGRHLEGVSAWIDEAPAAALLMVSEGQVNLQLPDDLAPGAHRLRLSREDRTEAGAAIQVAPHAPGLFAVPRDGRAVGALARESGEPVTPERPAEAGEILVALATGLGAPAPPGTAEFVSGDTVWQPLETLAGRLGVDTLRFRVPPALAAADGYAAVRLRVNGVESNTVYLPLR